MAILFEPEYLKQEIEELLKFCEEYDIECFFDGEDYVEQNEEDSDKEEEEEPIVYKYETATSLILPRSEYELDFNYSLRDILILVEQAKNSKFIDNYRLVGEKTALIRVTSDYRDLSVIPDRDVSTEINLRDSNYKIDIIQGLTSFNLRLTMEDMYNKYVPPIDENDIFISISSDTRIHENDLNIIFDSYFFELKSTYNIEIHKDPWTYELWDEEEEQGQAGDELKLRPLIQGKGIEEVLEIYRTVFNTDHPEQQILGFSRVIEYVSQTVIRKDLIEKTVVKLSTTRALNPDANYILELGKIYEEHKNLRKDYLAFKITIETCCDLYDLVSIAPKFLKKTKRITIQSSAEDQKKALEEIASSISSTRNMYAHAKTNYDLKGDECPSEQAYEFSHLMDIISQQIIRWFSRQQEDLRII
ncbi:hypothetical protein JOD03_002636 [Chryseomicrobium aureum]|uniref:hypothetical protein n=1 Tax=Chryseomicrobium aureum TaxID=1441723 RepID=UPI00195E06EE|nr:hypothetical protein [Chryseomicrobium aureum]MBM7707689.1 hypothetical protein [Chryseomicrobium aureum]